MLLRWKLAVVVGGATGAGHEVCLRLARAGSGLLVADPDAAAAEATAVLARERRVSAWSLRVDPADDVDVELLARRCRDLGGADILVTTGLDEDRFASVTAAMLPAADHLAVPAGDSDAAVAVAVLAVLRAADPGVAVRVAPAP